MMVGCDRWQIVDDRIGKRKENEPDPPAPGGVPISISLSNPPPISVLRWAIRVASSVASIGDVSVGRMWQANKIPTRNRAVEGSENWLASRF